MEANELFVNEDDHKNVPKLEACCCKCMPKRYLLAFLTFTGFVNVYTLRVNLSVAMVAMVSSLEKQFPNGTHYTVPAEFDWDSGLQGIILSSFFYGYIFTQIPGGWLAAKYGGKNLFGGGILMTALFTLVTPLAARLHPSVLILVRILEGLFEGFTFPCVHALWSKWAPPLERSKLATISFSGPFAGTVLGMPLSGLIAHNYGWPWVFYFFGLLGVIWSFFWFTLITDSPEDHPKITENELEYILSSLKADKTSKKLVKTPWKMIFTSLPVWAIIVAHFTENWGWYTLLTQLPTYLKKIMKFSLQEAGVISALPYLAMVIVVQCGGRFGDFLRRRNILGTTAVRRIFNSIGFFSQAIFLIVVGYTTNKQLAIIGLTLAVGLGGLTWTGFPVNHLDIAPRYASILFGISNCIATFPGMFTPILVGYITTNETQEEWRVVFFISTGVYAVGMVFYAIFVSGEKQAWNDENVSYEDGDAELKTLLSPSEEDSQLR
ncbi:vesicular glutamate transporter 3 isoform X1 [Hydra vulgaris]|uniref:vesicular glutamate transporter 3 isoform X1 n=1 Tax=Hydra vulgaris TaxID=6087 RepID=UPI00019256EB|nr:vesicular glutamate transporter 3 [Hydra vulgaris]